MGKKKNKKTGTADEPLQKSKVVVEWENYMKRGELEDWQRLMKDLGFIGEFPSKNRCRQALKTVWVNIPDFLSAMKKGEPVYHFATQRALAEYTVENHRFYPKKNIPKTSPLRQLLAQIVFNNRGRKDNDRSGLVLGMSGLSITLP
ncbi:hypothetical protein F5Y12DRAFT_711515 [Xylaria sp. FL1777]|nr:hypothetical protein F5Y12DRAFT_711515 [Xylaria sp. FL1777]